MRITYVARSFLDYRIPVLKELDLLCGGTLFFISSTKWTPVRALERLRQTLNDRAIFLSGEKSLGTDVPVESNTTVCVPYQPGLLRTIAQTEPEVLVGDGFFQWTSAALLYRILHGTRLVVCYERWSHTERRAQWYRRWYRRAALRFTAAICCNGRLSAEYALALGFPNHRIKTGHMAADTERLTAQVDQVDSHERQGLRKSLGANGVVLLYVGRLIKIKGLDRLLDTWATFEGRQIGPATLIFVGGGPEEQSLKSKAGRLGLRAVRFVGQIGYDHLARYYAAADALIIPTLEDNWSLVVPEAMACGLPILCSKFNGCWPELIHEGRNGWVFNPLDPSSILSCLTEAVRQPSRLAEMGHESQSIVAEHSPAHAARAIFSACEIALNAVRRDGPAAVLN